MEISEDELEKLVEKKVKEQIEDERKNSNANEENNSLSRRQFLKKLGAGTLGLGALSLTPTSALNIRSNGLTFYGGNNSNTDLDIDNSGNISVYGDLTDNNSNTIWDSSQQHVPASALESGTGAWEKIASATNISSGSTVSMSWNTSTTPDYDTFKVIFDFSFDTAGAKLYFQLQEDSSGSWTENYVRNRVDKKDVGDNVSETYIESNDQHATLVTNVGSASLDYAKGDITINGIRGSASQWGYYSNSTYADDNDYGYLKAEASGYGSSNYTYSGIRFVTSSGEFIRGNVALYGIKI